MDKSQQQQQQPYRGHSRNTSAAKASRPRSSTKGPLDALDTLTSPAATLQPQKAAAISAATESVPLSPPPSTFSASRSSRMLPAGGQLSPHWEKRPGMSVSTLLPKAGAGPGAAAPSLSSPRPPKDFSFLLRPEVYHPLNTTLVPPPFRQSPQQPAADSPLAELLASGHFRAAATAAAQELTSGSVDPTDHVRIFGLLYTRLACLLLMDAAPLAAQEAKALEDLNNPFYRDTSGSGAAGVAPPHLVPWELRVLHVRLQALGFGDPRRAVMSFYELAREARARIAETMARHDNTALELWKGRLAELGIKVAGALIEMEDLAGAAVHLASLSGSSRDSGSGSDLGKHQFRRLETAKALLWLHLGDVDAARAVVQTMTTTAATSVEAASVRQNGDLAPRIVSALCDMADDSYDVALATWRELRKDAPDDEMINTNFAVCLLYVGKMEEARQVLESLVDSGYSSHTLLFNLSTVYELCSDRSRLLKQQLAQRVANMPPSAQGWEKVAADFKL